MRLMWQVSKKAWNSLGCSWNYIGSKFIVFFYIVFYDIAYYFICHCFTKATSHSRPYVTVILPPVEASAGRLWLCTNTKIWGSLTIKLNVKLTGAALFLFSQLVNQSDHKTSHRRTVLRPPLMLLFCNTFFILSQTSLSSK